MAVLVPLLAQLDELVDRRSQRLGRERKVLQGENDIGLIGRLVFQTRIPELLAQLLAGAGAGKDDFDAAPRFEVGEVDQVFGQIEDAYLLAHAQHMGFAAVIHDGRSAGD